jgi:hypothetical protein
MGVTRNLLKNAVKSVTTKLMDQVGGKLVATIADTSSDAPDAYYTPKRNKFAEMVAAEAAEADENETSDSDKTEDK